MESTESRWASDWGRGYLPHFKSNFHEPILASLAEEGKLGPVILEAGSGAHPVSGTLAHRLIDFPTPYRVVAVDIAAREGERVFYREKGSRHVDAIGGRQFVPPSREIVLEQCFIREDLHALLRDEPVCLPSVERARRFLELPPDCAPEQVDSVVCSDILNYIDYQVVIPRLLRYLKKGGRLVIFNNPRGGSIARFWKNGIQSNSELLTWIRSLPEVELESERRAVANEIFPPTDGDIEGIRMGYSFSHSNLMIDHLPELQPICIVARKIAADS